MLLSYKNGVNRAAGILQKMMNPAATINFKDRSPCETTFEDRSLCETTSLQTHFH